MSDDVPGDQEPESLESKQEIIEPQKPREETPPGLLSRLIEIEHERIASADKRTEIMRLGIEANLASDNRQYEFHMERLRVLDNRGKRKDSLASFLIKAGVLIFVLVGLFLLGTAFYGNPRQSVIALRIIYYAFTAIGGYGVVSTIRRAAKKVMDTSPSEDV